MSLQLHNTLSRSKEPFKPIDESHVTMYVCGPTVYARPHIGNARSVVVYDVLFRLLKHLYPQVTYVRNITDVDDKINAAAIERGISIQELTEEVTGWFHDDMAALNCEAPTKEPKATQHITPIITMVERLIENGHAYVGSDGQHVLFDVTSYDEYGVLSGRNVEEQEAGARVAVEGYKKHPGDFVLWKPADAEDDASSKFDSPWGMGRPGWHIECSAMSTQHLGQNFDIHGGGADLKFPHHENEIAQSCCANKGSSYANYWVHNGFLTVEGEKMSKSLGNFITVRDLLDKGMDGNTIRLALLSTKYNKPLDWTDSLIGDSELMMKSIVQDIVHKGTEEILDEDGRKQINESAAALFKKFIEALCDDLNFSKAEAVIHETRNLATNLKLPEGECYDYKISLKRMCGVLGLDVKSVWKRELQSIQRHAEVFEELDIQAQIDARVEAKKNKDWATADRIRDELKDAGIILEDRPDGTTDWRRG